MPNQNVLTSVAGDRVYSIVYSDGSKYEKTDPMTKEDFRKLTLGNVTPDYPRALAEHRLRPNQYSSFTSSQKFESGRISSYFSNGHGFSYRTETKGVINGNTLDIRGVSGPQLFNMENEAISKLRNRIKDSNVNVAVSLAESGKAFAMISKTVKVLSEFAIKGLGGNIAGASNALDKLFIQNNGLKVGANTYQAGAANAWLELQYGWRPLMNDIFGAISAINKSQNSSNGAIRSSATVVQHGSDVVELTSGSVKTTKTFTWDASIKSVAAFSVPDRPLKTLAELGITNPALVAWELVPFSFVVDWLVPISSYLSSLDATLGAEFIWGYTTFYETRKFTMTKVGKDVNPYGYDEVDTFAIREDFLMTRMPFSSFPVGLPYVKNPLSYLHAANALALLISLKSKR